MIKSLAWRSRQRSQPSYDKTIDAVLWWAVLEPMRIATLVTLLVTTRALVAGQSTSANLFTGLELGSHDVGFRLLIERDTTRPPLPDSSDTSGRVMPIAVWYPRTPAASVERVAGWRLRAHLCAVIVRRVQDETCVGSRRRTLIDVGR